MKKRLLTLTGLVLALGGCGGGGGSTTSVTIPTSTGETITMSGVVSYDRVLPQSNRVGLDYDNIIAEKARGVVVQAVNASGTVIATTATDNSGNYTFALPINTTVKIRVLAMTSKKSSAPTWEVKVINNTNSDALYAMEGSLTTTGTANSSRNLHAPSGWSGSSYTSTRVAAPFAILDTVYEAQAKVLSANPQTLFPDLNLNWSVNNKAAEGDKNLGQISTSHYDGEAIYILGDANSDTDEYDSYIIAHEWGHYYEDKLSNANSIGGSHSDGEYLDIRVAFSEGFGNAFSAMVHDDPDYFDSMQSQQAGGFTFSLEDETPENPGWYSEGSVGRILYDLYDSTSDGSDTLSLGFDAIHTVFTGDLKMTEAFVSIFPYVTLLKALYPSDTDAIDALVVPENITPITNIYGTGQTNNTSYLPYLSLSVGGTQSICLSSTNGTYNKLGNRKYMRFTAPTSGSYTAVVTKTSGIGTSDPDISLYSTAPTVLVKAYETSIANSETAQMSLTSGSYLLDISEYNGINGCFTVSLNKN